MTLGRNLSALVAALALACGREDGASSQAVGAPGPSAAPGGAPALFVDAGASFAPLRCGDESASTILEVNGGGVALFDADDDGDLDVFLAEPGPFPAAGAAGTGGGRLYRNDGDFRFADVTGDAGSVLTGFCNGVAVGDVDGDGRRDLYVTRLGPNALWRNAGDLRFEVADDAAGAAGDAWSTSAVFVDMDMDGDLDLYVANYLAFDPEHPPRHGVDGRDCRWKSHVVMCGPQGLVPQADRYYRNDDGRFHDATEVTGFSAPPGYGLGVMDGDFDADGWPDVYVSNDSTPNFLFLSAGDGTVTESAQAAGAALSARGREQAGMGIAAGDLDADGREDILVTNFSMESNALYMNLGDGRFVDRADPMGVGGPSRRTLGWGAAFLDADMDGHLDLVHANGHVYVQADEPGTDTSYAQPDTLWLNDGAGRLAPVSWPGDAPAVSRALAAGDLDDDGVTDLVVLRRSGAPAVWRGTGAGGAGLRIVLQGPPGNPDASGAEVEWRDAQGTRRQRVRTSAGFQAAGDPRPVFAWRGPGTLTVRWPDGRVDAADVQAPGTITRSAAP